MKIEGGFLLFGRADLSRLIALVASKKLSLTEARVWLISLEMRSIRDAAEALRPKHKRASKLIPKYQNSEIKRLTGVSLRKISAAQKKLSKLGIELFSENKGNLPFPRRLVRFLGGCKKRSTFLVLLSYLERGLTLKNREVKNAGSIKAALIAKNTGLSLRAVKLARAELIALEIITPDTTKFQRKLNRDGAYFTINLSFEDKRKVKKVINRKGSEGTMKRPVAEKVPVDNFFRSKSKIAPLVAKICTQIAPPYRDRKSSNEFRNQKTQSKASNSSGFFTEKKKEEKPESRIINPPTIKNIHPEDLRSFGRMEVLFKQAIHSKLIESSEAGAINFLSAAVKARRVEGDAAKVFMGIIKKRLWSHITQSDEDTALDALRRYRSDNPERFRYQVESK